MVVTLWGFAEKKIIYVSWRIPPELA